MGVSVRIEQEEEEVEGTRRVAIYHHSKTHEIGQVIEVANLSIGSNFSSGRICFLRLAAFEHLPPLFATCAASPSP
jgi:hypothetical protein